MSLAWLLLLLVGILCFSHLVGIRHLDSIGAGRESADRDYRTYSTHYGGLQGILPKGHGAYQAAVRRRGACARGGRLGHTFFPRTSLSLQGSCCNRTAPETRWMKTMKLLKQHYGAESFVKSPTIAPLMAVPFHFPRKSTDRVPG